MRLKLIEGAEAQLLLSEYKARIELWPRALVKKRPFVFSICQKKALLNEGKSGIRAVSVFCCNTKSMTI